MLHLSFADGVIEIIHADNGPDLWTTRNQEGRILCENNKGPNLREDSSCKHVETIPMYIEDIEPKRGHVGKERQTENDLE